MRKRFALTLVVALSGPALGQHEHGPQLYYAQVDAREGEGASGSVAVTLALDLAEPFKAPAVSYRLTYAGLGGAPDAIRLQAAGSTGETLLVLCGDGAVTPCPDSPGATLSGSWGEDAPTPLTPAIAREIIVGRVFVELVDSGNIVARGVIASGSSMIMAEGFVSNIEADGNVSGTVVAFRRRMPAGATEFDYRATVAGLDGELIGISVVPSQLDVAVAAASSVVVEGVGKSAANGNFADIDAFTRQNLGFNEMSSVQDLSVVLQTTDERHRLLTAKLIPVR